MSESNIKINLQCKIVNSNKEEEKNASKYAEFNNDGTFVRAFVCKKGWLCSNKP